MVYKKCRWGLLHRQISVFYAGGKYDLCFGAAELLEFVDEVVQFHGGAEGYFDEHGVSPVTQLHSMTFGMDWMKG